MWVAQDPESDPPKIHSSGLEAWEPGLELGTQIRDTDIPSVASTIV